MLSQADKIGSSAINHFTSNTCNERKSNMAQGMVNAIETAVEIHTSHDDFGSNDVLIFFSTVDDTTKVWLKTLIQMWELCKKCEAVSKTLTDYFDNTPNPYLSTLQILMNTPGFNHIKTTSSLTLTVIEEFAKWIEPRREDYKEHLVIDLKIAAFQLVIKQKNLQFVKMVAATYEFLEDKEDFIRLIQQMAEEKKYKEAAQYAAMLQLQDHFANPETLLLPLILQNKLVVVEEFLVNQPAIQKTLLVYLDNLLAPGTNFQNTLDGFIITNNIPDVKMSTLNSKPMSKLIARFIKLYNVPQQLCLNLTKKRSEGALQFLMHKHYVECSLSIPSWREMVREAIGDDPKLKVDMIRMLVQANDSKEGLYWARELKVPKEKWPWAVSYLAEQEEIEGVNNGASTSRDNDDWNESGGDSINYHELQLSRESIMVIDNERSFQEFLDNAFEDVTIVGIDSEWKPSFGTKQTKLALIQIATKRNVYILDVTTMNNEFGELWAELGLILFENKNILKLGFGIAHDMAVIREIPGLSKMKTYGQGYLDIVHLWKKLVDDYKFIFPHDGDEHFTKRNLSKLVELCLGQRLNKSDQFSNWEQRPLRESQIIYAALDAYCLLEIYQVLEEQSDNLDIPFHDICAEIQHIPFKTQTKNIKKKPVRKINSNEQVSNATAQVNYNGQKKFQKQGPSKFVQNPYAKHQYKPGYENQLAQPNRWKHPVKSENYHKKPTCQNKYYTPRLPLVAAAAPPPPRAPYFNRIPAHKWRVVCDSMLSGLMTRLRICGCDCMILVLDEGVDSPAIYAMRQNRVLLTRSKDYLKFMQYLPPDKCYRVLEDAPDDQLREVLFHFQILLTQRDLFSRCQICNYDEFAKAPKSLMDELVKSFVTLTRNNSYRPTTNTSVYSPPGLENLQSEFGHVNNHTKIENRTWKLSTNSLDIQNCTTKYNMRVQIEKVPFNVLKNVNIFYICEHCGKVYWDGSRFESTIHGVIRDLIVNA